MKGQRKIQWVTVDVMAGSMIITPKEKAAFTRRGIDLEKMLKKIQREIYTKAELKQIK